MKQIFCGTWKEWKLFLKKHGNKTLGELKEDKNTGGDENRANTLP